MSITGSIGTISLSGLLQLLSSEQNTGILSFKLSGMEFQIFFLDGNIVYAIESQKIARLGELLINDKHITSMQLKECLKISVKKTGAGENTGRGQTHYRGNSGKVPVYSGSGNCFHIVLHERGHIYL